MNYAEPKHRLPPSIRRSSDWQKTKKNYYWCWIDPTSHFITTSVNEIFEPMSSNEKSVAAPDLKMDEDAGILSLA